MHSIQGTHYARLQEVPESYLSAFSSPLGTSELLYVHNGKIRYWESHYFHLMAAMRILRMDIPMEFTMEYLEAQIHALCKAEFPDTNFSGTLRLRVVQRQRPSAEQPVSETFFWLHIVHANTNFACSSDTLPIDVYKDHYRLSGLYQNMADTDNIWSSMAWVYAHENKFSDLIVLNEKKHIQGTLRGTLFVVKGTKIETPALDQGATKSIYREKLVAHLAQSDTFEFEQVALSTFALQRADELFVLESAVGFHSIKSYRKKQFESHQTKQLFSQFTQALDD